MKKNHNEEIRTVDRQTSYLFSDLQTHAQTGKKVFLQWFERQICIPAIVDENLDIPARIREKTIYHICWGKLKIFKQWFWRKLDIQAMVLGKAKYGSREKPRIILSTSAAGSCLSFSWI